MYLQLFSEIFGRTFYDCFLTQYRQNHIHTYEVTFLNHIFYVIYFKSVSTILMSSIHVSFIIDLVLIFFKINFCYRFIY